MKIMSIIRDFYLQGAKTFRRPGIETNSPQRKAWKEKQLTAEY